MSRQDRPVESRRQWLAGLAITLTTIVSYLTFWHLAPGVTFAVGGVALLAMIVAIWVAGGKAT